MTEQQWREVIGAMNDASRALWRLSNMLNEIDFDLFDAQRVDSMIVDMDDLLASYEQLEDSEYIEEEE